ncbi:hypothetical protein QCN27_05525 [Cereibacter sp. SYSU M97828]|nr:hypothetical protein [Cereibacter flavus]
MAEPDSSAEIEDVLSSIRRLVSEDRAERPQAPQPMGKLLLTPALRVAKHDTGPVRVDEAEIVASAAPPPFTIRQGDVYDRLAPIDEEVLHDLVRELMTEELQGPFGEKITRSIRKVVRAEIARALAARDVS